MELSEDIFNQIHQYLNHTLEDDDRQKFETQMNTNPALAQEVATQRRIKSGLKINKYKQQLIDIHAQLKNENTLPVFEEETILEKKVIPFKWNYVAYAASVTLIIGVCLFFYQEQRITTQSGQSLASVKKPSTPQQTIKTDKAIDPKVTKDEQAINQTSPINYEHLYTNNFTANPSIESPFSSEKYGISPSKITSWEADTLSLRAAINYLKTGKDQDAQTELEKLRNSKFEQIRVHSEWYLALAYLHQKDGTRTKEILKKISDDKKHLYAKKAEQILKVINDR